MLSRPNPNKRRFSHELDVDAMLEAAEVGDMFFFLCLLTQHRLDTLSINAQNSDGLNALMIACIRNDDLIVDTLLKGHLTNLNQPQGEGWTPLMLAIYHGSTQSARHLISDYRCNVSATDPIGGTALMYAAFHGRTECVRALLSRHDVNLNAQDHEGWSAVMYAAYGKNRDVLKLLLASPLIDLFLVNNQNETVEGIAVFEGDKINIELIRAAMQRKRPSHRSQKQVRFHQNCLPEPTIYNEIYTAVALNLPVNAMTWLDRGLIDVNALDYHGDNLAMVAAKLGHENMLKLLTEEYHADLTKKNAYEWTPLLYAALHGRAAAVTYLLTRPEIQRIVCDDEAHLTERMARLGGHKDIEAQIENFIETARAEILLNRLCLAISQAEDCLFKVFVAVDKEFDIAGPNPLAYPMAEFGELHHKLLLVNQYTEALRQDGITDFNSEKIRKLFNVSTILQNIAKLLASTAHAPGYYDRPYPTPISRVSFGFFYSQPTPEKLKVSEIYQSKKIS